MSVKRLLLVEDDRALAELIPFHFDRAGWAVTRTGRSGAASSKAAKPSATSAAAAFFRRRKGAGRIIAQYVTTGGSSR